MRACKLIFFWMFCLAFMIVFLSWAYHLVTPASVSFLTVAQLDKIQMILVMCAFVKVVYVIFKKINQISGY